VITGSQPVSGEHVGSDLSGYEAAKQNNKKRLQSHT